MLDLKELSAMAEKVIELRNTLCETLPHSKDEDLLKLAIMAGLHDSSRDGFKRGVDAGVAKAHDDHAELATTYGADLITRERVRQIEHECWTPKHDDKHTDGQLAKAARCYAIPAHRQGVAGASAPSEWPWDLNWWKPSKDRKRTLAKAGALIAAEIDRLHRLGKE